jgi:hypothetical protein
LVSFFFSDDFAAEKNEDHYSQISGGENQVFDEEGLNGAS